MTTSKKLAAVLAAAMAGFLLKQAELPHVPMGWRFTSDPYFSAAYRLQYAVEKEHDTPGSFCAEHKLLRPDIDLRNVAVNCLSFEYHWECWTIERRPQIQSCGPNK